MSDFVDGIIKNINNQIKYKNTVTTGVITVVNANGTYDVKINNATSATPGVESNNYHSNFIVDDMVIIEFKNGCKEDPIITGQSKELKQDPLPVEVDYSEAQTETETIYSETEDGSIHNTVNVYLTSRNDDGSGGAVVVDVAFDVLIIGQNLVMGDYIVAKAFLFFDTTIIPIGANITSAILSIYVDNLPTTNFYITIQDGQPNNPHSPLTSGDFNYIKYNNNGGQIYTSGLSLIAYTDIPLTDNGKNWINKGGLTKLCLRSSKDIASVAPADNEIIDIYAAEKGGNYRPKLTITYTI